MEYMKTLPDKFFDLAIVDPPMGLVINSKAESLAKMQFNDIVKKGWEEKYQIKFILII